MRLTDGILLVLTRPQTLFRIRPAMLDDASPVADLETARAPHHPEDAAVIRFFWAHPTEGETTSRLVEDGAGQLNLFISARHEPWREGERRFGSLRVEFHPAAWTPHRYRGALEFAESWLRAERAQTAVVNLDEYFAVELDLLRTAGYREVRRQRAWQLDLVSGRDRLLAAAERTRASMKTQGIQLLTLDKDRDPERVTKLFVLDVEATDDVPTTVPWHSPGFDEWRTMWFDNPATLEDRFWIAREGDAIVGFSVIGYPPQRGIPWTQFTCSSRAVRGRGIARALKNETVAQAIALGVERIETRNDSENAAILHLNEEFGYQEVEAVIELHRDLAR